MSGRTPATSRLLRGLLWSGAAGLVFGVLGSLAALAVVNTPLRIFLEEVGNVVPVVGLAALSVGGACWWLVVELPQRPTRRRGALAGLLTGVLSHPAMWLLLGRTMDGSATVGTWLLLFTHWSLGLTGTFTVFAGVAGGLAVTVARERTLPEPDEPRSSLGVVLVAYGLLGVGVVVAVLALSALLPAIVGTLVVTVGVTAAALRRLPTVRATLVRGYRLPDGSGVARRSFLVRHAIAMVVVGVAYLAGLLGFASVGSSLFSVTDSALPDWLAGSRPYLLYSAFFLAVLLAVALAASRLRGSGDAAPSLRRAALEWVVFLVLTIGVFVGSLYAIYVGTLRVILVAGPQVAL